MIRLFRSLTLAVLLSASGTAFAAEKTVTLAVENMFCAACPYIVKRTLAAVSGVSAVAVSYQKRIAIVTYDDDKTDVAALTDATSKAGYPSALKAN